MHVQCFEHLVWSSCWLLVWYLVQFLLVATTSSDEASLQDAFSEAMRASLVRRSVGHVAFMQSEDAFELLRPSPRASTVAPPPPPPKSLAQPAASLPPWLAPPPLPVDGNDWMWWKPPTDPEIALHPTDPEITQHLPTDPKITLHPKDQEMQQPKPTTYRTSEGLTPKSKASGTPTCSPVARSTFDFIFDPRLLSPF